MNSIRMLDCITGQGFLLDLCNRCLYLDGISNRLGYKRYKVLYIEDKRVFLKQEDSKSGIFITCAKMIFICSLLFPLLFLLAKRANLKAHIFTLQTDDLIPKPTAPQPPPPIQTVAASPEPQPTPEAPSCPIAKPFIPPSLPPLSSPQLEPLPCPKMPNIPMQESPPSPLKEETVEIPASEPPPEEPSPEEPSFDPDLFRTFVQALTDHNQSLATLQKQMQETSDAELVENEWEVKSQVRSLVSSSAVATYRAFIEESPTMSLYPPLKLEDGQGASKSVDRLLACAASPVLEAALRTNMKEAQENRYSSPDFEGVLDALIHCIEQDEVPCLKLQELIALYKVSHELQMPALQQCRQKLVLRLLHGKKISLKELKAICELATLLQDSSLRIATLKHLSSLKLEAIQLARLPPEFASLYAELTPLKQMSIHLDEAGRAQVHLKALNEESVACLKRVGIEDLKVETLFDASLAEQLTSIRSLTLADMDHFDLKKETLEALFKHAPLASLNLCYCDLDLQASLTLSQALSDNNSLKSLRFDTVRFSEEGLSNILKTLEKKNLLTSFDRCRPAEGTSSEMPENIPFKTDALAVQVLS